VPARGVIQSPVLIGRDAYLPLIERRLAGAAEGEGRLPFVAGEAGIGPVRSAGRGWRNGAVAGQPGGMARSSAGSAEIVSLARQLGPDRCRSAARCYELTRDAAESVRLMTGYLRRPDLLDQERLAPWRGTGVQDAAPV
jgi:hypothetical protein